MSERFLIPKGDIKTYAVKVNCSRIAAKASSQLLSVKVAL